MDLKNEIMKKENEIKSLLSEFSGVKNEIETLNKVLNMNKTSNQISTKQAKLNEQKTTEKMSELKKREVELSKKITKGKGELKNLYQQYKLKEFNLRPEANLVVGKSSVYVQGDESKTNVFDKIVEIKIAGVNEVRQLIENDDVERYYQLYNELTSFKDFSKLPKVTPELLNQLENLKNDFNIPPFNYFIYNGRIAVDRDFLTKRNSDLAQMASILYGEIDKNNERLKSYKPTFWQKLNKKNEQKERETLENEVNAENEKHNKKIKELRVEVDKYTSLVTGLIVPSTEIMPQIEEITTLLNSNEKLEGYIQKVDAYKDGLKNNTFLKNLGYNDMLQILPQRVLAYLNENHLKISKENLIKVLSNNSQFKDIAAELKNALSENSNQEEKSL